MIKTVTIIIFIYILTKYTQILDNLDEALNAIEAETEDVLIAAEKGLELSKTTLESLRKVFLKENELLIEDEIQFFKYIKPHVYSKLIYYVQLFNIESKRPRSRNKAQINYFNKHLKRLPIYFNDNVEFYQYHRAHKTHFDKYYFVRGKENIRLFPDSLNFFIDKQFSTSHDCTVATIMAYDMLIVYLNKEIEKLENKNGMETIINPFQNQSRLFWTANKTDLIELIYALHSSGVINSGTADIKEMATACEQLFNIDLGDFYRTFLEIRSRKTNQTKFIDKLRESLLQKMDELDE